MPQGAHAQRDGTIGVMLPELSIGENKVKRLATLNNAANDAANESPVRFRSGIVYVIVALWTPNAAR